MGKKPEQTKKYEVQTKLTHNGDKYRRGETVDLTDEQAKQLLEARVVRPFQSVPTSTATTTPPTPPNDNTPSVITPEGSDPQ